MNNARIFIIGNNTKPIIFCIPALISRCNIKGATQYLTKSLIAVLFVFQVSSILAQENSNRITVGVLENWPPHYTYNHQKNRPTGFAIEVFEEVAKQAGLDYRYKVYKSWPDLNHAFKRKEVDLIPNIGITQERKKRIDFTTSYNTFNIQIFVRQSNTSISMQEDLGNYPVGVVEFNKGLHLMKGRNHPNLRIYKSLEEALFALLAGEIDALVYPETPVKRLTEKTNLEGTIKTVGKPLQEIKRAIGIHKGNPELLHSLNQVVSRLVKTKRYEEIYQKWFGNPIPYWSVRRVLLHGGIIGGLLLFVIVALYYRSMVKLNRKLKKEVDNRIQAEESLKQLNTSLESTVKQRTEQIEQVLSEKELLLDKIVQREEQLHTILNSTDALVFMQDLEGRYLYFNGSDRFGLNAGDVVGKTPNDFFDAETAEKFLNRMQAVQKSGQKQSTESNLIWNGEQLTFVDEFSPVFDKDGAVIATSCFCHNVTDLKKVETDLRSSEQQFRLMFEKSPYAAALTDTHSGRILDVNEMFCTKTGLNKEEVTGHTTTEMGFYSEEDRNQFINHLTDHGTVEGLEMQFQAKQRTLHARMFARTIKMTGRNFLLTMFEDVTEQKNAEDNQKKIMSRLLDAQKIAKVGDWEWNPATDSISWSEQLYQLIGLDPTTTAPDFRNMLALYHEEDAKLLEKAVEKTLKDGTPYELELRRTNPDGSDHIFQAKGAVEYNDEGVINRVYGSLQDITQSKTKEKQIQASLKEKETLLKEIHHRVKNNMNVVSGLLSLHKKSTQNEEVKNALQESQGRVYAMSAVHEALYNSKNLAEIDLIPYLNKLSSSLLQTYSVNPGKVQFKIDGDNVKVDINKASPLGLTINELISNALKYAFPDERKGMIEVTLQKQENRLALTIQDDGVGMPEGFDWKNSNTLGLKLVRNLIENQLNGSIEADTQDGTRFTIKINLDV